MLVLVELASVAVLVVLPLVVVPVVPVVLVVGEAAVVAKIAFPNKICSKKRLRSINKIKKMANEA